MIRIIKGGCKHGHYNRYLVYNYIITDGLYGFHSNSVTQYESADVKTIS